MWNVENKTNNKNGLIDMEKKLVVARAEGGSVGGNR